MSLDEEVNPDSSTAQRSTTTGHLVITMPKVKAIVARTHRNLQHTEEMDKNSSKDAVEKLEVDPSKYSMPDIGAIVKEKPCLPPLGSNLAAVKDIVPRENSPDFVDDPDVPPLL